MNRDACLAPRGHPWLGPRPPYFLSSAGESYEHVALIIIYSVEHCALTEDVYAKETLPRAPTELDKK